MCLLIRVYLYTCVHGVLFRISIIIRRGGGRGREGCGFRHTTEKRKNPLDIFGRTRKVVRGRLPVTELENSDAAAPPPQEGLLEAPLGAGTSVTSPNRKYLPRPIRVCGKTTRCRRAPPSWYSPNTACPRSSRACLCALASGHRSPSTLPVFRPLVRELFLRACGNMSLMFLGSRFVCRSRHTTPKSSFPEIPSPPHA